MQDYVHQLAVCLHWLAHPEPSSAKTKVTAQLHQQTEELSFLLRRLYSRPKSRNAIVNAKLDEGAVRLHALDDKHYRKVTVSHVNFSIHVPTHMVRRVLSASTAGDCIAGTYVLLAVTAPLHLSITPQAYGSVMVQRHHLPSMHAFKLLHRPTSTH